MLKKAEADPGRVGGQEGRKQGSEEKPCVCVWGGAARKGEEEMNSGRGKEIEVGESFGVPAS